MRLLRFLALVLALVAGAAPRAGAAEVLPPVPVAYCNDGAGILSHAAVARIDQELKDYERQTSNQILVAIYPRLPVGEEVADYTVRLAQSWHVGQKAKDNGAVLFIFAADHQVYLQVGYGLEGAIPDVTARRIIANEITPRFRQGDYDGGVEAGVAAIFAAARGEYRGNGTTHAEKAGDPQGWSALLFLVFLAIFVASILFRARGSFLYSPGGYSRSWSGPGTFGGWGGGGGGGGGGGFSGGGGGFGGGGAGGSW